MRSRRIALGVAAVALVAGAVFYTQWLVPTREAVGIGAAMLAKQMCTCMFVAGRAQDACRADQMASLDPIQAEVTSEPQGVRAFISGLGERSAVHSKEYGCTLQ